MATAIHATPESQQVIWVTRATLRAPNFVTPELAPAIEAAIRAIVRGTRPGKAEFDFRTARLGFSPNAVADLRAGTPDAERFHARMRTVASKLARR